MQGWNVLLVDDEVEFAATLAERLALRGILVRTAFDGDEALRLIDEEEPQVVILDLMMPGLGGKDVLARIKKKHPRVQVILLTGHGSTRDGIDGMQLGAFDYLMKPLSIEELLDKIGKAIGKEERK